MGENLCGYCEVNFRIASEAIRDQPFCWRCSNDLIVIFESDQRAAEKRERLDKLKDERSA